MGNIPVGNKITNFHQKRTAFNPSGSNPQAIHGSDREEVLDVKSLIPEGSQLKDPFSESPFIHQPVSNYRTDATINYERLKDRNKRLRKLMDLDPRTTEAMLLNIAGAWEAGQIQKQFNEIRGTAIKKAEAEAEKKKKEAVKKDFKERIKTRWPDKDDQAEISKYPARFNKLVKENQEAAKQTATDASSSLLIKDSADAEMFRVRDDGVIKISGQVYTELVDAVNATLTVDWDDGNIQELTSLTGALVFTASNPKIGATYILTLGQTGTVTPTWTGVKWPAATAPTLSGNLKTDVITLVCYDATGAGLYYGTSTLNFTT